MKTLTTKKPYDFFDFFKSDFNSKIMENLLNHEILDSSIFKTQSNIKESNDCISIEMIIPGFSKEEIEITMENDLLTISGKKENSLEDENVKHILREYSLNEFKRSFKVNPNLDIDSIESTLKNGILYVKVPKPKKIESKKIIKIN